MFKKLQRVGKSFMLPIAILPAAGLLLGIGGALSNPNTVAAYPFLDHAFLQGLFKVMSAAGDTVFGNLPLLLTIGLAAGLADRDQATAVLAAVVGYLVMNGTIGALLSIFEPDAPAIDTGVIGSLAIGLIAVRLHNKYRNIVLPEVLGFFGGSRFVPIVTSFAAIFVGFAFYLIWPPFQNLLVSAGEGISKLGVIGTFFYGFLMRLSGAAGLHHMIYPMFWYTELGGVEMVAGKQIVGAQNIFFAQLADPSHVGLYTHGTRYFAGRFATMMFGLPAASYAMYKLVPSERRGDYKGLFLGVALTSLITGITEPIEFMFLFLSPPLYVIHSFLDGVSFMISDILRISIGNTFSGGFIDFLLFGILQGNAKTNWMRVIPMGIAWAALYYGVFTVYIKHFDVPTPGRKEEKDQTRVIKSENEDLKEEAVMVLKYLGGEDNISSLDACITRLRVGVLDVDLVDREKLKQMGATDVLVLGDGIQAIFGAKAILYKNIIEEMIE